MQMDICLFLLDLSFKLRWLCLILVLGAGWGHNCLVDRSSQNSLSIYWTPLNSYFPFRLMHPFASSHRVFTKVYNLVVYPDNLLTDGPLPMHVVVRPIKSNQILLAVVLRQQTHDIFLMHHSHLHLLLDFRIRGDGLINPENLLIFPF